jgi:hypothetical protein
VLFRQVLNVLLKLVYELNGLIADSDGIAETKDDGEMSTEAGFQLIQRMVQVTCCNKDDKCPEDGCWSFEMSAASSPRFKNRKR